MTPNITLSAVRIPARAKLLINEALDSGMIGQSPYVDELEEMVAAYVGSRHCIAVTNGTMADAIAVAAMKYKFGIKRVVIPALTFIAQPNSVRYNNLDIVFTDVGEDWIIDVEGYFRENTPDAETLLFFTDIMGRTIGYWNQYNCRMIEDACEAFGSQSDGVYAGTLGTMGTFSFFPSHTISTGEGGAIVTDDDDLDKFCRILRSHGSISYDAMRKFTFPYLGFNGRMTTMQACLGISLMEEIHTHVNDRRKTFKLMGEKFHTFVDREKEEVVPHGYPVGFSSEQLRDDAMKTILQAGIECRKFFSCIPTDEEPYKQPRKFPVAEHISHTHLYLPCHQNMTPEDVEYIAKVMSSINGVVS